MGKATWSPGIRELKTIKKKEARESWRTSLKAFV